MKRISDETAALLYNEMDKLQEKLIETLDEAAKKHLSELIEYGLSFEESAEVELLFNFAYVGIEALSEVFNEFIAESEDFENSIPNHNVSIFFPNTDTRFIDYFDSETEGYAIYRALKLTRQYIVNTYSNGNSTNLDYVQIYFDNEMHMDEDNRIDVSNYIDIDAVMEAYYNSNRKENQK